MSTITSDFRQAALRHGFVIRSSKRAATDANVLFAAVIELANYGYRVFPDALDGMSDAELTALLSTARAIKGADRDMTPIYPGFPAQVKELSTLTLVVEQLMHYWTLGAFLPDHPKVVREGIPLSDIADNVQTVTVLDAEDASWEIVRSLASRGVALSPDERSLLRGGVALARPSVSDADRLRGIISGASNGENIQVLLSALLGTASWDRDTMVLEFAASMTNSDQLLRLVLVAYGDPLNAERAPDAERAITTLSNRDARAVRMRSMNRAARRVFMENLGRLTSGFAADRLVRRNMLWHKAILPVHPYSQIKLSSASRRAVDIIRGNVEHSTLDSLVESAIAAGKASMAITLLSENRPSALLSRCVELMRVSGTPATTRELSAALREHTKRTPVSALIRAYNGIIGANFDGIRVVREAGRNNRLLDVDRKKVPQQSIDLLAATLADVLRSHLADAAPPAGPVGVASDMAVPLVRRDLSSTDRVLDRGSRITPAGKGDVIRFFSHWVNTHNISGYLDLGVVVMDAEFRVLATTTWDSWQDTRSWSTYSGDKFVYPGDSAVEFFDVELTPLRQEHPSAKWAAMTIQSWSGIPLSKVDMIAGTMRRSDPNKGAAFDARSVTSAFRPTTDAFQAVPLVVDLGTGDMVWLDGSSGSTETGMSAAADTAVGPVVRDELTRPRLTMGDLAEMWASAHGVPVVNEPVDRDAVLALLD